MSWVTVKRVVRAGFLDFWRNGFVSLASILVMTVTLFVVGTTIFAGMILGATLDQLRDKADINVYFTTDATPTQIGELQKSVQALPQVQSVQYTSATDALAQFRAKHQNDQLTLQALDELGTNPLGAVLNIKAKDISQYDAIAQFLESQQTVGGTNTTNIIDKVNYFDAEHRAALERLSASPTRRSASDLSSSSSSYLPRSLSPLTRCAWLSTPRARRSR
jgi:cell division transport system permease protein